MKRVGKLILFLCFIFSLSIKVVNAKTLNWCGQYFERNNIGYISMLRSEAGIGSSGCSFTSYKERIKNEDVISVRLDFSRSKLAYSNWRKFVGHIVEVRGKYQNASIGKAKLLRDLGGIY
jgi:hypothetical protein